MNDRDYTGPGMSASDLGDDGPDFGDFAPPSFNLAVTIMSLLDRGGPRVSHTGGPTVTRDITSFAVVQDGLEMTVAVSPAQHNAEACAERTGRCTYWAPGHPEYDRIVNGMADADLLDTPQRPAVARLLPDENIRITLSVKGGEGAVDHAVLWLNRWYNERIGAVAPFLPGELLHYSVHKPTD